jgi:hypothetical protein
MNWNNSIVKRQATSSISSNVGGAPPLQDDGHGSKETNSKLSNQN